MITPKPTYRGRHVREGGVRLHDLAVEPDGTIVAVGDVVQQAYRGAGLGPVRPPLLLTAPTTGFSEVKALASGKLLATSIAASAATGG